MYKGPLDRTDTRLSDRYLRSGWTDGRTLSFIISTWADNSSLSERFRWQISCLNNVKTDSFKHRSRGCSPSSSVVCSGAEFIPHSETFKYLVVAKCPYTYMYYIYWSIMWKLYFYTKKKPLLGHYWKNPDVKTLYILKQGYRQKCRSLS